MKKYLNQLVKGSIFMVMIISKFYLISRNFKDLNLDRSGINWSKTCKHNIIGNELVRNLIKSVIS